jgi:hypothetical protein
LTFASEPAARLGRMSNPLHERVAFDLFRL